MRAKVPNVTLQGSYFTLPYAEDSLKCRVRPPDTIYSTQPTSTKAYPTLISITLPKLAKSTQHDSTKAEEI